MGNHTSYFSIKSAAVLFCLICPALVTEVATQSKKKRGETYTVEVVDVSPVLGLGIERKRVPANVQTLEQNEIEDRKALSLTELLNQRIGSVALNDMTNNPFQQDLRFRGFTASPLLGLPQGVAIYQNGVRINEPFGDAVQFDLIPEFAIRNVQVIPGTHPVYGLNALGGSVGLEMKNGFSFNGSQAQLYGGSFGRYTVSGEHGLQAGNWGGYVGLANTSEEGWRDESPSDLTQLFADLAYQKETWILGSSFVYADTNLNGNGPAPAELLAVDRSAVFTFPDNTRNDLSFFQSRGSVSLTERLSLQGNGYYRNNRRRTLNGDEGNFEVCEDETRPPAAPPTTLCQDGNESAAVDLFTGDFVTTAAATGDGVFNRTETQSEGYGASFEGVYTRELLGLQNYFLLGTSLDVSDVDFGRNTEIGTLTTLRTVHPTNIFIGEFGLAPDDQFNVDLRSENRFSAVYLSNTLSLTDRLHLVVAGRYNNARLDLFDRLGTSLDGNHRFDRFNPAVGLTYQVTELTRSYLSYGESNRFPTAAELSCADPAEPCRLPNAFISDPPLEQVVSRSIEVGAQGQLLRSGSPIMQWSAALFGSRNSEDIIFVASPVLIGSGFFQNAGRTQRIGAEIDFNGAAGRTAWYTSYALVSATFESRLLLPGDPLVNSAATASGELIVEPGDRLPGIPLNSAKLGLSHSFFKDWTVAIEAILFSSRFFLGDEGNDQEPVPGYGILNLRSSYPVGERLELFATVNNLLNRRYETFGVLAELELSLEEAPEIEDTRFVGPGAPRGIWGGLRVRF